MWNRAPSLLAVRRQRQLVCVMDEGLLVEGLEGALERGLLSVDRTMFSVAVVHFMM